MSTGTQQLNFICAIILLVHLKVELVLSEDLKKNKGVSLTFVFDTTASMTDELEQMIEGAQAILKTTNEHPDKPIYNYILAPFNDPYFGPVSVTTDPVAFNNSLKAITLSSKYNTDCPELSLSGLKLGVEASLPGSYIYVFTDASAKDYERRTEVEDLIQRKHTQVVFVVTGICERGYDPMFKAYESIATLSGGHVFSVSKEEVINVLGYVRDSVKERNKVVIVSIDKAEGGETTFTVPVDATMVVLTVSLSGMDPNITIKNPFGDNVHGDKVLDLPGVLVVKILNPNPGNWRVDTKSSSRHAVRVTSVSEFDFQYGFSVIPTDNINETLPRPFKGSEMAILVEITNQAHLHNLTKLLIVETNGTVSQELDFTAIEGEPNLFRIESFISPTRQFKLEVQGVDDEGNTITRITPTSISPQKPDKPVISIPPIITAKLNSSVNIKCHVQSPVPFKASLSKDESKHGPTESFKQTAEVVLHLSNATLDSEGNYTCRAENFAGESFQFTTLSLIVPPPKVVTPEKIFLQLGKKEEIPCQIESKLPYTVNWLMTLPTGSSRSVIGPGYEIKETGNLVIESVKYDDGGSYHCSAQSRGGRNESQVRVDVWESVHVSVSPKTMNFVNGNDITLTCSATGSPKITLKWKKDGINLIKSKDKQLWRPAENTLKLLLKNLSRSSEGNYECVAKNDKSRETGVAELKYVESPTAAIKESYKQVLKGSSVLLKCETTGVPKPNVSWSVDGTNISMSKDFEILGNDTLKISSLLVGGNFTCTAENHVGKDEDIIKLDIGTKPEFIEKLQNVGVKILSDDVVPCKVAGSPKPIVHWERKDGKGINTTRFIYNEDNCTLKIRGAAIDDEGIYTIKIKNAFGEIKEDINITITGIVNPKLMKSGPEKTCFKGEFCEFSCEVLDGYPPPTLQWYKDGISYDGAIDGVKIKANGSLIFYIVTHKNDGDYECIASNIGGESKNYLKLTVLELPIISGAKHSTLIVRRGGRIELPCIVWGEPKPDVKWSSDCYMSNIVPSLDNNLLVINATEKNNGTYECIARNNAGERKKIVELLVQDAPKISPLQEEVPVIKGMNIRLECGVTAFPPAEMKWLKDGELLADNITYSENNSSISFPAIPSAAGHYECIATNIAGQDKAVINVTVMVPPDFKEKMEKREVREGEYVTLICYTDAIPPAKYTWHSRTDRTALNSDEVYSGMLPLPKVRRTQVYTCTAVNDAGYSVKEFFVKVIEQPKIYDFPAELTLRKGDDYKLVCKASSVSRWNITWQKDGKPLSITGYYISKRNLTPEDSGLYTCIAANIAGVAQESCLINVEEVPVMNFTDELVVEADLKSNTIISCPPIQANSPLTIRWQKDLQVMEGGNRSDDNRSLTITNINEDNAGVYTCIANNSAGKASANITLNVLTPPRFTEKYNWKEEIKVNRRVEMNCICTGNPTPEVTWFRNGHKMLYFKRLGITLQRNKQVLLIKKIRLSHKGEYLCKVHNKVAEVDREFNLIVIGVKKASLGSWSNWGGWSNCMPECGKRGRIRIRNCTYRNCEGDAEEYCTNGKKCRECEERPCKVEGSWDSWSPWSPCRTDSHCGSGERSRHSRNGTQTETCILKPCPIDGSWSDWSDWAPCSGLCSMSRRRRIRHCSNPSPALGGSDCEGEKEKYMDCTLESCPVNGEWSSWSEWSPCSTTCGPATQKRLRTCTNPKPRNEGSPCAGDSKEVKQCSLDPCDGIPMRASVKLTGTINGQDINTSIDDIKVADFALQRIVEVTTKDTLKLYSNWFPYLQFILSPLVWSTAFQKDGASNGYSLTRGNFKQTMDVVFATGEKMTMIHKVSEDKKNNEIRLEIRVDGRIPSIEPESSVVSVESYEEDYVQTGSHQLSAISQGTLVSNSSSIGYTWTKKITLYEVRSMPYKAETLTAWDIKEEHDSSSFKLSLKVSAAIGKKIGTDFCPDGFLLQTSVSVCQDIDECADPLLNNCHLTQTCINHVGSYECVCPTGFKASANGFPCSDIDECKSVPKICSHTCNNIEGGFRCVCPTGFILKNNNTCVVSWKGDYPYTCPSGFSSQYGECYESKPCYDKPQKCKNDQICINIHGRYQCLAASCPKGFKEDPDTSFRNCFKLCSEPDSKCESGTKLTENFRYVVLEPDVVTIRAYWNITTLEVRDKHGRLRPNTSFRIKENVKDMPFQIKMKDGVLYSIKYLPAGKDYRTIVEALSYNDKESEILHKTEFLILIRLSGDTKSLR